MDAKALARKAKWRAANREKCRAADKRWRTRHPEKSRANREKWKAANPEKTRASIKAWELANPDKLRAIKERWVKKHPERRKEVHDAYYAAHREEVMRRAVLWMDAHPEVKRSNKAARRARECAAAIDLTKEERIAIREFYRRRDWMTQSTGIPHHVDHIVALAKGGKHHPSNLQILTASENLRKAAR